jgi:hypothetical protein
MTSIRTRLWNKIIRKSETKQICTIPPHLKTSIIKIMIISKGEKL